jgi:hypothetical protein
MTRQISPYPAWPVFWKFSICGILLGITPGLIVGLLLQDIPDLAQSLLILPALLIIPSALLAAAIIAKCRIYRDSGGILTATAINVISGIACAYIAYAVLSLYANHHGGKSDGDLANIFTIIVVALGIPAGWITAFFTLPAKPVPPEEH